MANYNYPMILVFYLSREVMLNDEIRNSIQNSINITIEPDNIRVFMLPTDGVERVECLNPQTMDEKENERVKNLITRLEKQFDLQNLAEG